VATLILQKSEGGRQPSFQGEGSSGNAFEGELRFRNPHGLQPTSPIAPMVRMPFRLYIVAEDVVIQAVLTQIMEGKEHIITYLSWRLIDTETRYSFIEKLYLSLFFACSKLQHYLLSSTCIVVFQADAIRHMLQQPILSGRIGKWAYALIEYDLAYESLKSMKDQVVADFIVRHSID
jgi:uncharacterized membrane protein (GlpM family)